MHRKGLTLMEILVSTIILAVALVALANVFFAGKTYIQQSRSRITAGEVGKFFADTMHAQVNQAVWSGVGNCLSTGNCVDQTWTSAGGDVWTVTWSVTAGPTPDLRRVVATIEWTLHR